MPVEAPTRHRLAVLLPVTSKSAASSLHSASKDTLDSVLGGLRDVAASLRSSSSSCLVIIGIDSDDDLLLRKDAELKDVFTMVGVQAIILLFSEADRAAHGQGALCHLWGLMGKAAVKEGCSLAVLLGEDCVLFVMFVISLIRLCCIHDEKCCAVSPQVMTPSCSPPVGRTLSCPSSPTTLS